MRPSTGAAIVAVFSLSLSAATTVKADESSFQRAIAAAEASLRAGDRVEAERLYEIVLQEGEALTAAGDRATPAGVRTEIVRAGMNLGILRAQAGRYAEAADTLSRAAELDPEFPGVQRALGIARFNADQFDRATEPLQRALAAAPGDDGVRRMLALSWLNLEAYDKAAKLLEADPKRHADPDLQYAYGLSLVRSGRAAEAEQTFSRLLAEHGDSAKIAVVLGQAHAQGGDYPAAIRELSRALALDPTVADANGALGVIYLKQGKLPEAEAALRAEVSHHPKDVRSQRNLATVLGLLNRPQDAIPVLRSVVHARPRASDGHYLLGKMLLETGGAAEAVGELEKAAALAPDEPSVRYQLAKAYQKVGRLDDSAAQFARFRELKDARRGEQR